MQRSRRSCDESRFCPVVFGCQLSSHAGGYPSRCEGDNAYRVETPNIHSLSLNVADVYPKAFPFSQPSNVVLLQGCRLKLLDFDTCKFCLGNFSSSDEFESYSRIASREFRDNRMPGTTIFTAPEVLKGKAYGRALDW